MPMKPATYPISFLKIPGTPNSQQRWAIPNTGYPSPLLEHYVQEPKSVNCIRGGGGGKQMPVENGPMLVGVRHTINPEGPQGQFTKTNYIEEHPSCTTHQSGISRDILPELEDNIAQKKKQTDEKANIVACRLGEGIDSFPYRTRDSLQHQEEQKNGHLVEWMFQKNG